MLSDLDGVPLQCNEIMEGVGPAKRAGCNEAHEHVPDVGPVLRAIEHAVFAVQYGPFKHLLTNIVVKRSPPGCEETG